MKRRPVTIHLADGPCADRYATVMSYGEECFQKLSVRDEVWCKYVKNLFKPGEYVWSGDAVTTNQLQDKVTADKQNTYGSTQGA